MIDKKERIEYIDLSRALAIILITMMHALTNCFNVTSHSQTEFYSIPFFLTIVKAVIYVFSRIGLCFFLMITGALMLPRDYTRGGVNRFIKHNWLNLFITTEIWLVIMFLSRQMLPGSILLKNGIKKCILSFISTICFINPVTLKTMWYMPMILCVYLMIPVFSLALKNLPNKYFVLPCCLVIFSSFIIPMLNGIFVITGSSYNMESKLDSANLFSQYMIFLLAGFFIQEGYLDRDKSKYLIMSGSASVILFCGLQLWAWSTEFDHQFGMHERDIFLLVSSICFFALLRRIAITSMIANLSAKLSDISFGIYFIHIFLVEGLTIVLNKYAANVTYLSKFVILELFSFGGSILIIQLLRKNKILSKYLLGIRNNS